MSRDLSLLDGDSWVVINAGRIATDWKKLRRGLFLIWDETPWVRALFSAVFSLNHKYRGGTVLGILEKVPLKSALEFSQN